MFRGCLTLAKVSLFSVSMMWMIGVAAPTSAQESRAGERPSPSSTSAAYDWKKSFGSYKTSNVPRTRDGKPDLQGLWSASILTPLERPGGSARVCLSCEAGGISKEVLTEEEADSLEEQTQQKLINQRIFPTTAPPGEKGPDAYNTFWRDGYFFKIPVTSLRTAQVVDPPDGHVPTLTSEALKRQEEIDMRRNRRAQGPEDIPVTSRCIRGLNSGPPIIGSGAGNYLNNLQIVQSPNTVAVLQEMVHETQLIPLTKQPHIQQVRLYKGNPRGHWDGDTLVVESTNFRGTGAVGTKAPTERAHLVERWKRLDDERLLYGFTIEDPGTWTKPWSAELVLWRMKDQKMLVEYACHEGNFSMEYALSGARALDKEGESPSGSLKKSGTDPEE